MSEDTLESNKKSEGYAVPTWLNLLLQKSHLELIIWANSPLIRSTYTYKLPKEPLMPLCWMPNLEANLVLDIDSPEFCIRIKNTHIDMFLHQIVTNNSDQEFIDKLENRFFPLNHEIFRQELEYQISIAKKYWQDHCILQF
ncbi:hypothetical protein WA1_49105 [Scytonema hofmannii PCC 7110]|uniref:Uncharacterized protein n=1 Tax=Scytonema hofmannii PCC 7110 TaxID=128403 RepID=A0A139WQJ3_9CYAN|nr:hypothetical protein [Scytonema hofmannii]KYC34701.1 hypothetical protein WA1_49105 [Scytonema hofmannii PCC 7110]